jgi:hypothetical protein
MYGREMRGPHDRDLAAYVRRWEGPQDVKEQVDKLVKRLRKAREATLNAERRNKESITIKEQLK